MIRLYQGRHSEFPRWSLWLAMAVLLGLGACRNDVIGTTDNVLLGPPDGTEVSGQGTAMGFIGINADGCEMFQPTAEQGTSVIQAIHFRTRDGRFSSNQNEAHCVVKMMPNGVDAEGCEVFRPVWPNGESLERPYYRAGGGYVTFKAKAICGS